MMAAGMCWAEVCLVRDVTMQFTRSLCARRASRRRRIHAVAAQLSAAAVSLLGLGHLLLILQPVLVLLVVQQLLLGLTVGLGRAVRVVPAAVWR